ncbi:MAG: hypothetical protein R3321_00050 [Nitrososphaeraceae archaeon]|nr:hypothetical protein [Nitrososphaeraceae archaeon]
MNYKKEYYVKVIINSSAYIGFHINPIDLMTKESWNSLTVSERICSLKEKAQQLLLEITEVEIC